MHPLCFPENRSDADLINAVYLMVMGSEELVTNPHLRAQFILLMVIVLPRESHNPRDTFMRKRNCKCELNVRNLLTNIHSEPIHAPSWNLDLL